MVRLSFNNLCLYLRRYASNDGMGMERGRLKETIIKNVKRPTSPIIIYQPQLTWLMSIGHRVTGATLATLIYGFGIGYLWSKPKKITENVCEFIRNEVKIRNEINFI